MSSPDPGARETCARASRARTARVSRAASRTPSQRSTPTWLAASGRPRSAARRQGGSRAPRPRRSPRALTRSPRRRAPRTAQCSYRRRASRPGGWPSEPRVRARLSARAGCACALRPTQRVARAAPRPRKWASRARCGRARAGWSATTRCAVRSAKSATRARTQRTVGSTSAVAVAGARRSWGSASRAPMAGTGAATACAGSRASTAAAVRCGTLRSASRAFGAHCDGRTWCSETDGCQPLVTRGRRVPERLRPFCLEPATCRAGRCTVHCRRVRAARLDQRPERSRSQRPAAVANVRHRLSRARARTSRFPPGEVRSVVVTVPPPTYTPPPHAKVGRSHPPPVRLGRQGPDCHDDVGDGPNATPGTNLLRVPPRRNGATRGGAPPHGMRIGWYSRLGLLSCASFESMLFRGGSSTSAAENGW